MGKPRKVIGKEMSNLNVNKEQIEGDAASMSSAASYFVSAGLAPTDSKTTITANGKSKDAFGKAQMGIATFGSALDQDVENIRSLNVSFEEFDQMMGKLAESGPRTPTISAPK